WTIGADDLADLGVEIRHRLGIEAVGGAAAFRHVEFRIDQIDGNDWIGTGKLGELYEVEAYAADAENHHGFADLDFGVVVDDAGRGGHGAAQQRRIAQVIAGRDHRHPVLRHHGMFVE